MDCPNEKESKQEGNKHYAKRHVEITFINMDSLNTKVKEVIREAQT